MFVLTRNIAEAIEMPPFDVSVAVQSVKSRHVRLVVCAPTQIPVPRGELWLRMKPQPQPFLDAPSMKGVRVLLADPDVPRATRYKTLLLRQGYEVAIADNGLTCVSSLRRRPPHVLVLDAGLLWGRAEGVLALMEEHADVPDIPVLVVYDESSGAALLALRRFSVCAYVAKSLAQQELDARIRKLVSFPDEDYESKC